MLKIEEIAKRAGVSKTAVSFALNNKPGISDGTRAKILRIVEEFGYSPKSLTVRLSDPANDPKTILLLIGSRTDITSAEQGIAPFISELIRSIEKRTNELGYHLWLKTVNIDDRFKEEVASLLDNAKTSGVLLIATDMLAEDVETICPLNRNLVVMDSYFDYLDLDCVVMDNFQGAYQAAEYLMNLGHVNIGYVQSHKRIYNFEMRKKGFETALIKRGLNLEPNNVFTVVPTIDATSSGLKEEFEKNKQRPTAIFAENDYMAIGTVKYLLNAGLKVPEDVSVVGFDNIEAAAVITPELTTLNVPKETMSCVAVEKLIKMIEGDSSECAKVILTVKLIQRQSCMSISI